MSWSQRRASYQWVFAMVAAAALITPARAQQGNIRSVRFYHVKPDRIGDFQGAIKEFNAVLKKGGSNRHYTLWVSLTGATEYARVDYYTKWADLDVVQEPKMKEQAQDLQRIGIRINQCTEGSNRIIDEVLPDLSLPRTAEIPKMVRTLRTRVRPDKVNDYLALVKSEVLPAAKKAGLKEYSLAQTRYGAPISEFLSVAGVNNWADFDGGFGVQKAMGEEVYQRFLAKLRPLILESEYNVYRFLPDLSYLSTAPSGSTTGN
jgi:hypothetical protein